MAHDDEIELTPPPKGRIRIARALKGGATVLTIGVAALGCSGDDSDPPMVADGGGSDATVSPMVMFDAGNQDAGSDGGDSDGGGSDGGDSDGGPPSPMVALDSGI